jgi:hypothetical protein
MLEKKREVNIYKLFLVVAMLIHFYNLLRIYVKNKKKRKD